MWLLINDIQKNFEMVKLKKRTCITQSGKNYAINCAIQGVRLIWKQKVWLASCKFLWSLTNQNAWFVPFFCTELTLFYTVYNQSKWRNFFMYIIKDEKERKNSTTTIATTWTVCICGDCTHSFNLPQSFLARLIRRCKKSRSDYFFCRTGYVLWGNGHPLIRLN